MLMLATRTHAHTPLATTTTKLYHPAAGPAGLCPLLLLHAGLHRVSMHLGPSSRAHSFMQLPGPARARRRPAQPPQGAGGGRAERRLRRRLHGVAGRRQAVLRRNGPVRRAGRRHRPLIQRQGLWVPMHACMPVGLGLLAPAGLPVCRARGCRAECVLAEGVLAERVCGTVQRPRRHRLQ